LKIPFVKIEGLGNDYIYVDENAFRRRKVSFVSLARAASHRRFGIGSDGLIAVGKLGAAAASMAIYNSDGSRAEFCGNGLRGTALYMKSVYRTKANEFSIFTRWREYRVVLDKWDGKRGLVKAAIGAPSFDPEDIGFKGSNSLGIEVNPLGKKRVLYCVAMPNPHAVIFVEDYNFDWQKEAALIENSPIFRNRINVMYARIESPKKISLFPWERGSGATMACGSGAAAATVISNLLELTKGAISIRMPGGSLSTRWDIENNQVYQHGPARIAFSGIYTI
jgi:diaminopimelate epimerase